MRSARAGSSRAGRGRRGRRLAAGAAAAGHPPARSVQSAAAAPLAALGYLAGQTGVDTSGCCATISRGSGSRCCAGGPRRSPADWKPLWHEAGPMSGASSWSFREDDARAIQVILSGFLGESNARTALIVDRTGQMVATVGEAPQFDPTAFASLTAADFSANDQLARMLGEPEFGALFHQGERESMYLADMARRVILVVLFDNRTTLGLVKLRVKAAVGSSTQVFTDMFNRDGTDARRGWSPSFSARRKTRSTNSSGPEGDRKHVDDQLRLARDQLQARLLRARARRQDHQPGVRLQQGRARLAREDDLPRHRDRADPVLRFPAGRPRHHPRVQGQVPPLHRARAGLLQRLAQADPQGRGRRRVRGRQPDRADGREHRGHAEPVREHDPARLRPDQDSVRHPVQQARPPQRRPGRPSCRRRSIPAGRWTIRPGSG